MDFLDEEFEEILNIFREENDEHVQKINHALLTLEKNPADKDIIAELFREAHSIKGAARMIGLDSIQSLAHKFEDIIGLAKSDDIVISPQIIDVLCKSVDCITNIVEQSIETKGEYTSQEVQDLILTMEDVVKNKSKYQGEESITASNNGITCVIENSVCELSTLEGIEDLIKNLIALMPDVLIKIDELKVHYENEKSVSEFGDSIKSVYDLLLNTSLKDLSHPISSINHKMNIVKMGSGILTLQELDTIIADFDEFLTQLEKLAVEYDIKFEFVFDIEHDDIAPILPLEEDSDAEEDDFKFDAEPVIEIDISSQKDSSGDEIFSLSDTLVFINTNMANVALGSPESILLAGKIIEKIQAVILHLDDENLKDLYEKISLIVDDIKKSKKSYDIEVIKVIKQTAQSASEVALGEIKGDEDILLLVQRLEILHQMLDISVADETMEYNLAKKDTANDERRGSNALVEEDKNNAISKVKTFETGAIKTLRVDTKKLDQLVNQAGELIVAKIKTKEQLSEIEKLSKFSEEWYKEWSKAKQYFKYFDKKTFAVPSGDTFNVKSYNKNVHSIFEDNAEKLNYLINKINSLYRIVQEDDTRLSLVVNDLEELIKSVRVLPLATIFHMFPRMVRDIARDKGKKVELIISGSETSADKKLIEEIKSPLMHILRNAIDHGIETPDERIAQGKDPVGKIFLTATHYENSILIEIVDDGSGINIDKIKEKVLEKELVSREELEQMTPSQIMNILFWPGFSTEDTISDISGRGVGLDVVHTKIHQLNGKVDITSEYQKSCKVSIQLPVTMATLQSFLVSIASQTYAIPTGVIKTAFWINPDDIFYKEGQKTIIHDNISIPIFELSEILDLQRSDEDDRGEKVAVLIVQTNDSKVGFIIDKLLGEQEILHKNLPEPLLKVRNIAGVTTLASGKLCLIINMSDVLKTAFSSRYTRHSLMPINNMVNAIEKKQHLLVVDDSITTRILEKNILQSAGFQVTVAENGFEALTKLASNKFDLVVSDVEMPEINGIELTKRLKQEKMFKTVPIILVTSLSSDEDRQKALVAGADAYIAKSRFDQGELLFTIKSLLNKKRK